MPYKLHPNRVMCKSKRFRRGRNSHKVSQNEIVVHWIEPVNHRPSRRWPFISVSTWSLLSFLLLSFIDWRMHQHFQWVMILVRAFIELSAAQYFCWIALTALIEMRETFQFLFHSECRYPKTKASMLALEKEQKRIVQKERELFISQNDIDGSRPLGNDEMSSHYRDIRVMARIRAALSAKSICNTDLLCYEKLFPKDKFCLRRKTSINCNCPSNSK